MWFFFSWTNCNNTCYIPVVTGMRSSVTKVTLSNLWAQLHLAKKWNISNTYTWYIHTSQASHIWLLLIIKAMWKLHPSPSWSSILASGIISSLFASFCIFWVILEILHNFTQRLLVFYDAKNAEWENDSEAFQWNRYTVRDKKYLDPFVFVI